MVVAANFSVTGVEYRLLTTLIVSACETLRSYVSIGYVISETEEGAFLSFSHSILLMACLHQYYLLQVVLLLPKP